MGIEGAESIWMLYKDPFAVGGPLASKICVTNAFDDAR